MSWSQMSFKGQTVWVRSDENGRPILDPDGRAEMKYRENDKKSYRPSPQNLLPAGAAGSAGPVAAEKSEEPRLAVKRPVAKPLGVASADTVHVWTDGACSGNPGPMGIGIVVTTGSLRKEHGEYLGRGTNNIAELTAIRRGLEIARELVPDPRQPIRVYTDSSYAIGLLSQGWKAKANQQLVAEIRDFLRAYPSLRMVKVEGHAGVPENERCDLLARQAVAQNR
jgi:ribonuclease HI